MEERSLFPFLFMKLTLSCFQKGFEDPTPGAPAQPFAQDFPVLKKACILGNSVRRSRKGATPLTSASRDTGGQTV